MKSRPELISTESKKHDYYLVYENWRAKKQAVVHHITCGHAIEAHDRIKNNSGINDRWFGYFDGVREAVAFATLLPNRKVKICGTCLKNEKKLLLIE